MKRHSKDLSRNESRGKKKVELKKEHSLGRMKQEIGESSHFLKQISYFLSTISIQNMISKDEVKHIALLARLGLSDEELQAMQKDLSGVLDFFRELQSY